MTSYAIQVPRVIGLTHEELREIAREVIRESIQANALNTNHNATIAPGCAQDYSGCKTIAEALERFLRANGRKSRVSDAILALKDGGYPKLGSNPLQQVMIAVGSNEGRFWRDGDMVGIEERRAERKAA